MPVLDYSSASAKILESSASVILIRHGNSMFNKLFHELEGPGYVVHPSYFDIYSKLSILDSPLSPLGISQCMKASSLASMVNVGIVYISPLRRAIETAYFMFKDHPNFKNIKFIIHPIIRENIMTAGDIPDDINLTLDQYGAEFPNLDTSNIPKIGDRFDDLYYTQPFHPDLKAKIKGLSKVDADLKLCDDIPQKFPKSIEFFHDTNGRVHGFKQFLLYQHKELIRESDRETAINNPKIAIVGHSYFFKLWTGVWHDPLRFFRKQPNEYVWLENCEMFPDVFNFPIIK